MSLKYVSKTIVGALTALALGAGSLGVGSAAFAQPRDDDHRGPDHGDAHRPPDRQAPPPRVAEQQGAGPDHNFRRGGRLPSEYRSRQYVVDDWRGHHLSAPPRGYHWVQTGGDYVLAAIATGVIADILLNH